MPSLSSRPTFAVALGHLVLLFAPQGFSIDSTARAETPSPRLWTDSAGTRQVVATLIEARGDEIVLLKECGHYARPPFGRLSAADQAYVRAFQGQTAGEDEARSTQATLRNVLWANIPEFNVPGLGGLGRLSLPGDGVSADELPTNLVYLVASRQFLEHYVAADVRETRPVRSVVVGTAFSGTAAVTGRNSLEFAPNQQAAELHLLFRGTSLSNSVGGTRVRIHSHATTHIQAVKRVLLSEAGIQAMPTAVTAQSWTEVVALFTDMPGLRGRIAKWVTRRRSDRTRSQANAESARGAEETTRKELDALVDGRLAELNNVCRSFVAAARQGNLDLGVGASTSADALRLVVFRKTAGEPTDEPLPPPIQGAPPVGIWLHGSLIKRVLTDAQLQDTLRPFLSGLAIQAQTGSDEPTPSTPRLPSYRFAWSDDGKWLTIGLDLPRERPVEEVARLTASVAE